MRNSICTPIFYKTALATVNEDQDGFQERNSSKPDHSNFLKSNSLSGSQQWVFTWCAHNASVCKDPAKFPSDLVVIESTVGAATMFAPSTVSESLGCLDMRAGRRRRLLQSIPGVWHHSLRSWKHERRDFGSHAFAGELWICLPISSSLHPRSLDRDLHPSVYWAYGGRIKHSHHAATFALEEICNLLHTT
ncbi:hypothetical protein SELMODRAFT_425323 [Selaginella moellendorffii]|uniref:Uncharacterized protein n=1 Tax=Selaginella moellendorffii TaxID=88036 RepID=D8SSR1_SELML|nr:hypothetical protein SELMODRAFT_425323 [Selaginella moellendorffii]